VGWSYGDGFDDRRPLEDYLTDLKVMMSLVYDVTRDGGVFCLNLPPSIRTETERSFPTASWAEMELRKMGWKLRESITWVKSRPNAPVRATTTAIGNYKNPFIRHCSERILIASRGALQIPGRDSRWPGDSSSWVSYMELCKDIWLLPPGRAPKGMPLKFPKEMVSGLVYLYSNPGDTVLDPYAGTGSVGEVARRMGRDCVLCEIDPKRWPDLELITDQMSLDRPDDIPPPLLAKAAVEYETPRLL
jgi:DNA modification methylase